MKNPTFHPNHHLVPHEYLGIYRQEHEPDNTEALCSTCPEHDKPNFPQLNGGCSGTCGSDNVWVDDLMFVKLRLEGLI